MLSARLAMLAVVLWGAGAASAAAQPVTLFRVFLNDGTALVSYGEFARVGDRLVFTMPLGPAETTENGPALHVVNLPMASVNWTATEKYAASARYDHYIRHSAESDYAAVAGEVAATLNAIVVAKDAKARLELALGARRRLASWPKEHHGYRADDVREMLGLLDEAISGLRVAAGESSFALELVAAAPAAPPAERVPMLRTPSNAEALAYAIAAAKATDIAADRVSILRGVVTAINEQRTLPKEWAEPARRWALHVIREEARADKQYAELAESALERASKAAARADVRGVERALDELTRRDQQLGRRRPEEVNALIAQVQAHLDAARRLRLARERWRERIGSFQAYKRGVAPVLETMERAQRALDDIKSLAGSDPDTLVQLADRFVAGSKTVALLPVPDELKPSHALLTSALQLAERAVRTRRQAVSAGDLNLAWDASSAAAGSMMLLARAQEDMAAAVRLPEAQ